MVSPLDRVYYISLQYFPSCFKHNFVMVTRVKVMQYLIINSASYWKLVISAALCRWKIPAHKIIQQISSCMSLAVGGGWHRRHYARRSCKVLFWMQHLLRTPSPAHVIVALVHSAASSEGDEAELQRLGEVLLFGPWIGHNDSLEELSSTHREGLPARGHLPQQY